MIDRGLRESIASIVEDCGYQLWHCDYLPQGKHSILRVYIDHREGISLEDCGKVSRQVSAFLDVEDPISGTYSLEVSSPGWPKPLFNAAHYQQFLGSEVELKLMQPVENKRKYVGEITAVDDNDNLFLKVGENQITIALSNIVKAQLTD